MANSETRFRLDAELDKWLEVQAAKSGLSKTKYIIQVLEVHKNSTKDSTKDSTNKAKSVAMVGLELKNSTEDSTKDSTNVRLADIEARLAKLEASQAIVAKDSTKDSTEDSTKDSTENARSVTEVELVSETPQETPQKTPQEKLSNAAMKVRLGYGSSSEDNSAFSGVCEQGRGEGGYLDANGDRWVITGKGKSAMWAKE